MNMKKTDGAVRNRVLPWAVGVAILGCVLAVSANVTTSKIHENLANERHLRMILEQQLQGASQKIQVLERHLAESQEKLGGIEAILNQGKDTTNDLRARLDSVTKEKERLAQQMVQLQNQTEPSSKPDEAK